MVLTKCKIMDQRFIINQLVSQQFFLPPNLITDRTHSIKIEIKGAEIVFKHFTEFLYEISNHLYGIEPTPYLEVLSKAGKGLNLEISALKQRFQLKAGSFIHEGLATETILYISTVATILEILDIKHYQYVLQLLFSAYIQFFSKNNDIYNEKDNISLFDEGIKRLGEIADSNFSLFLNLIKLIDLAKILNLKEKVIVHSNKIELFKRKIIHKIISGEY